MIRTKAITYALLSVFEIGRQHKGVSNPPGVSAAEIARKYRLPTAYTAKILSQLANAGVLLSDRGPRGGFRLARSGNQITLQDVISGVGGLGLDDMVSTAPSSMPTAVSRTLRRAGSDAADNVKGLFERIRLDSILSEGGKDNS